MTICPVLECTHNNRLDISRCLLPEIELDDRGRCISFEADNEWLRRDFQARHGYLRNLEKARHVLQGRRQPPVTVRAETLHDAARGFLIREEEEENNA